MEQKKKYISKIFLQYSEIQLSREFIWDIKCWKIYCVLQLLTMYVKIHSLKIHLNVFVLSISISQAVDTLTFFILPQRYYLYVVTPQMSNIFVFTLSLGGVGVPRSSFYSFEMNTQSRDEPKRESQGISRLILVIVPCLRGDPDSQHFFFFFPLIHPSFYLLCQFVPG